jgi:hypothetical protein
MGIDGWIGAVLRKRSHLSGKKGEKSEPRGREKLGLCEGGTNGHDSAHPFVVYYHYTLSRPFSLFYYC